MRGEEGKEELEEWSGGEKYPHAPAIREDSIVTRKGIQKVEAGR